MLRKMGSRPLDDAAQMAAAKALGLDALLFLVREPQRLVRFLEETGLDPATLRDKADSPQMLAAVIGHLMGDESLLLVFAAEAGIAPEAVAGAQTRLEGRSGRAEV